MFDLQQLPQTPPPIPPGLTDPRVSSAGRVNFPSQQHSMFDGGGMTTASGGIFMDANSDGVDGRGHDPERM